MPEMTPLFRAFDTPGNIISFLLAKGLEAQGRLAAGSVFTVLKNARVGYYDIWSGITGVRDEGVSLLFTYMLFLPLRRHSSPSLLACRFLSAILTLHPFAPSVTSLRHGICPALSRPRTRRLPLFLDQGRPFVDSGRQQPFIIIVDCAKHLDPRCGGRRFHQRMVVGAQDGIERWIYEC